MRISRSLINLISTMKARIKRSHLVLLSIKTCFRTSVLMCHFIVLQILVYRFEHVSLWLLKSSQSKTLAAMLPQTLHQTLAQNLHQNLPQTPAQNIFYQSFLSD